MNTTIKLPEDIFNPERMPNRDENGYLCHPDFWTIFEQLGVDDEGEAACKYIKELGYEFQSISLEDDASEGIRDKYFENGDPDIKAWEPSRPDGKEWQLFAIYDHEDGPRASFIKKVVTA